MKEDGRIESFSKVNEKVFWNERILPSILLNLFQPFEISPNFFVILIVFTPCVVSSNESIWFDRQKRCCLRFFLDDYYYFNDLLRVSIWLNSFDHCLSYSTVFINDLLILLILSWLTNNCHISLFWFTIHLFKVGYKSKVEKVKKLNISNKVTLNNIYP